MTETAPARTPREPATLSTLVAWRRTGLVLSGAGALFFLIGVSLAMALDIVVLAGISIVAFFVCLVIGYGFLQRAWSDPLVADDPQAARLQRWSGVAGASWSLAFLIRLAVWALPDGVEWLRWVGLPFGVVGIAAYVGVLVLAARWRPGRV